MNAGTKPIGDLTVFDILEKPLGSERASQIIQDIQNAVDSGLKGEELNKRIFELLCKYVVEDVEVYHILLRAPQVVT